MMRKFVNREELEKLYPKKEGVMSKKKEVKKEPKKEVVVDNTSAIEPHIGIAVVKEESKQVSSVGLVTGAIQIISYRKAHHPHRELGLALEAAEKLLNDSIKWINEANAIIENQKIECPKI